MEHLSAEDAVAHARAAYEEAQRDAAAAVLRKDAQREKQLAAAHKANREREVQAQTDYKGQGWDGVNALISGEGKTSSDLGRMRQILTRLKHAKPATSASGMFSS